MAQDGLAFEVFDAIGKPVIYDKEDAKLGRFLIRGMVRAERVCNSLKAVMAYIPCMYQ